MAKVSIDVQGIVDQLSAIREQLEVAKESTRETASVSRALASWAKLLDGDTGSLLVSHDLADEDTVTAIADRLAQWSAELSPMASVTWKRDEVQQQLVLINSLRNLGLIGDDYDETVTAITEALNSKRSSGGTRMPQESLQGRIPFVVVMKGDEIVGRGEGKRRADTKTSVGNIASAVAVALGYDKTGTLPRAARDVLSERVTSVVSGEVASITFEGITVAAA